jgi:hypothetical protein
MSKFKVVLLLLVIVLSGCANKIVKIESNPNGAEVLSNLERLGTTPLTTSKDEIMPFWRSDMVPTYAVITIRKSGFQDYKVRVSEFDMPDMIDAVLFPTVAQDQKNIDLKSDPNGSIENRLAVLKRLLDNGTITNVEYDTKKKELLNKL